MTDDKAALVERQTHVDRIWQDAVNAFDDWLAGEQEYIREMTLLEQIEIYAKQHWAKAEGGQA